MWKIVKHCETSLLGVSFASLAVSRRMIYRQLRIHFDQLHTSHSCNVHEKHHLKTPIPTDDSTFETRKKVHLNCSNSICLRPTLPTRYFACSMFSTNMSCAVPRVVSFVLARRSRRACQCCGKGLEISRTCWTLSAPQALDESTWWFYPLQSHCRPCTSCHSVWNWTIRRNALHKPSTHFTLHIKWVKISECLKITNCRCNEVIPSMYM